MRVHNWMVRQVVTVSARSPIREVLDLMRTRAIRHLPVMEGERLIGIVTDRDVRRVTSRHADSPDVRPLGGLPEQIQVGDLMSTPVITVSPEASIVRAADLMSRNRIGCLPVLDGEVLVGIITTSDILRAVAEKGGMMAFPEVPLRRRER